MYLQVSACVKDLGCLAGAAERRTPRSGSAARQRRAQNDGRLRGLPRRPTLTLGPVAQATPVALQR